MQSMRCYIAKRELCRSGYMQLLQLSHREAHCMLGLQGTTATYATKTTTGTHGKEQAKVLHVQASAGTYTDMPTPQYLCLRQTISKQRCYVLRRLRFVHGTTKKMDRRGLREEYSAYDGRVDGVRQTAYEWRTTVCVLHTCMRAFAAGVHVNGQKKSTRSRMRPRLHAVSVGSPNETTSKAQIFALRRKRCDRKLRCCIFACDHVLHA